MLTPCQSFAGNQSQSWSGSHCLLLWGQTMVFDALFLSLHKGARDKLHANAQRPKKNNTPFHVALVYPFPLSLSLSPPLLLFQYKPLHGDALLYKTDARFHDVVVAASPPPLEDGMVTTEHRISQLLRCDGLQEHVPGNIYTLPLLTPEQCALIHQELAHFATQAPAILKGRVNSMNRNGLLLDEVGFTESLVNKLVRDLRPVCGLLFGPEFETLDHHRAFTVWYGPGRDTKLAKHFDNAEVTINVNLHLSEDAKGGEVDFFGPRHSRVASCTPRFRFRQAVGQAVLHLGSEMHCALPQAKGERHNLVIWMRSSTYRTDHGCPMCGGPWHLEQSTTTGRSR
eukprot:m.272256 g.272256  ORF g.272256 m.272256 type:complete len:341 (+) comp19329_c0_seq23:1411-2433(+)